MRQPQITLVHIGGVLDEIESTIVSLKAKIQRLLGDTNETGESGFSLELHAIDRAAGNLESCVDRLEIVGHDASPSIPASTFSSELYHDLRTFLNPIIGYSALILYLSRDKTASPFNRAVESLGADGRRLLESVSQLESIVSHVRGDGGDQAADW